MDYGLLWNIVILGDCAVGKTSFVKQYVDGAFSLTQSATIGMDFSSKKIEVDKKVVKLHIWDTNSLEFTRRCRTIFYKTMHGCILLCDITNLESLFHLPDWLIEFRQFNSTAPVIMVGNNTCFSKCKDLSLFKSYIDKRGLDFIECNAKTGENVQEAFDLLIQKMNELNMLEVSNNVDKSTLGSRNKPSTKKPRKEVEDCFTLLESKLKPRITSEVKRRIYEADKNKQDIKILDTCEKNKCY